MENTEQEYIVPNKIAELVKDTVCQFWYYQNNLLWYHFELGNLHYSFPVDISDKDDIGNAIFGNEYKTITLMRYLRKAIENKTLIWSQKV